MKIKFSDIMDAFDYVSFGQMGEHQAYLDRQSGKIYLHTEFGDNFEELPDDIDDDKYIEIPDKRELDLGTSLVFAFADQQLPGKAAEIAAIFNKKGAYSRYKALLEQNGMLDKWYAFETKAMEEALRKWCEENELKILN